MDSLTVTIIGGVVVVLIGLFVEYGYLQKRRRRSENVDEPKSLDLPAISRQAQIDLEATDSDLSWPEAINKAIEDFSLLHKGKTVELNHTETDEYTAWLQVYVWTKAANLTSYSLIIDKSGKIIKIDQTSRH